MGAVLPTSDVPSREKKYSMDIPPPKELDAGALFVLKSRGRSIHIAIGSYFFFPL